MAKNDDTQTDDTPPAPSNGFRVLLPIHVDGKTISKGSTVTGEALESASINIPALVESGHIKEG